MSAPPLRPPTAGLRGVGLHKRYGRRPILDGVDIEVGAGQIVGLLGPNGAGKTTCFYLLVGLLHGEAGEVFLDDHDITHRTLPQRARAGLGYLPQEASVFRSLSVENNIRAVLEQRNDLDREQRQTTLESLLDDFQLNEVRQAPGQALSGGERRRTEIARALAGNPRYLCLDEPFAGVDPLSIHDIQQMIRALQQRGIGILLSDHNVRETLAVCDTAYILSHGKILSAGTPEQLLADPRVREAYLGSDFAL